MADPTNQPAAHLRGLDVSALLAAGQALGEAQKVEGCYPFILKPAGTELARLPERPRERPEELKAAPTFHDATSFIAYVKRFKDGDSQLFADLDKSVVVAVMDYHQAPLPAVTADGPTQRQRHGNHVATYTARASEEWKVWVGKNGAKMSQVDFVSFLEDNYFDVLEPSSAEMLTIASNLDAKKSVNFSSGIRLDNGQHQLAYEETINGAVRGNQQLQIPSVFKVGLAPYVGCARYPTEARLRYRVPQGQLSIWFDLLRHVQIQRDAFEAIVKRITDETAIPVYAGTK
jgi:uncharacterized protein YfdQ (DUF2303 family)